jgi:hypothetical protein
MSDIKPKQKEEDLVGLMKKMQIDVVGRETGKDSDFGGSSCDEDFEDDENEAEDDDEEAE